MWDQPIVTIINDTTTTIAFRADHVPIIVCNLKIITIIIVTGS